MEISVLRHGFELTHSLPQLKHFYKKIEKTRSQYWSDELKEEFEKIKKPAKSDTVKARVFGDGNPYIIDIRPTQTEIRLSKLMFRVDTFNINKVNIVIRIHGSDAEIKDGHHTFLACLLLGNYRFNFKKYKVGSVGTKKWSDMKYTFE